MRLEIAHSARAERRGVHIRRAHHYLGLRAQTQVSRGLLS